MAGDPRSGSQRGFRLGQRASTERQTRFFRLHNPAIQVLLFTAFMVGLVLLTTRTLTPDSRFEVQVGTPAPRDIKATQDYIHLEPDIKATQKKRNEAAQAVPKVYDFRRDLQNQKVDNIQQAFSTMRGRLEEALEGKRSTLIESNPDAVPGQTIKPGDKVSLTPEERVTASKAVRAEFDQALQAVISDQSFETLARVGFSTSLEEAMVGMVHEVMDHKIVPKRRLLDVEGSRGITLRTLDKDTQDSQTPPSERHSLDFSRFLDASEVRSELERISLRYPIRLDDPQPKWAAEVKRAVLDVAEAVVEINTEHNEEETQRRRNEARADVDELVHKHEYRKGQNIVDQGHVVTELQARVIRDMNQKSSGRLPRAQLLIGTIILLIVMLLLMYTFARANIVQFQLQPKDIVLLGTVMLLLLLLQQLVAIAFGSWGSDWPETYQSLVYYGVPMAVGAMLVRLAVNSETAIVFIVPMALFAGLGAHQPLEYVAYLTAGSLVGANAMGKVTHRMDLLKAGLMVGLVNAVMICSVLLLRGEMEFKVYLVAVAVGFSSGLMSGVLVSALLPLIEWAFDYTTDIKLLELADLNHPALRELIMKAPGSYHHSVIVGNLCKEAAEAIGANPLLARVGAYYHDIGKGKNPQYFAENQRQGNNPHDKLKPNMSALIIKAHVKDGLELARQHNLPREIEDFIAQHHGTNLIAYFYHRAKSLEDPDIPEVDEKDYRYPGPKPQTRETAICLLADGIEAASRAMPDPTPDRLKGLVQKMINKAFADGQLDECELTLKDLNAIAKAFIRVLMGMYHSRPQYPEDKRKRDDKRNKPQPSGAQQRPPRTQSNNSPPKGNARADTPVVRARPTKSTRARRGQAVFEDRLGDNNPEVLALNQPKRTTEFPSQKRGAAANAASKASPSKTEPKASHTTKPLPGHTPRKKDPANRKAAQDAPKTGSAPGDDEELETLNDIGAIIDNRTPSQENNTPPAEDHAAPANGEAEAPYPEAQGDALQDSDEEAELEEEQDDHAAGADRGESGGDDLGDNDQPPPPDEPDAPPLRRLGLS